MSSISFSWRASCLGPRRLGDFEPKAGEDTLNSAKPSREHLVAEVTMLEIMSEHQGKEANRVNI